MLAGEELAWRRELMPLPHEMRLERIQRLRPADVAIRKRAEGTELERASAESVAELFHRQTGVRPTGREFTIQIGLLDGQNRLEGMEVPLALRLQQVPNRDQAYAIQPLDARTLAVTALSDRGIYYGTQTLSQWLERHLNRDWAEIPLATVLDWPDLEERGFWHLPVSLVPWCSSLKMNRFYVEHEFDVDSAGIHPRSGYNEPDARLRQEWTPPYAKARRHAAEIVPGLTHMDFYESQCTGYKEAFPELIGKGEGARNPFVAKRMQRVPCATQRRLAGIIASAMTDLARQGASEVMVWTSEYPEAYCGCVPCRNEGQFRAEVRSAVEGWTEAKRSWPDLKLSVFFGRGGFMPPPERRYPDEQIRDIAAGLPPDVTLRVSMGCDGPDGELMKGFAADGKRISRMYVVYLCASFLSEDIRERMRSIVADKYVGAWQFTPGGYPSAESLQRLCNYRLSALAEYSWNAEGRDRREFAAAWAVRHGLKDPARFAEWIEAMNVPQSVRMPACWPGSLFESWFGSLCDMAARRKWDGTHFQPGEPEEGIRRCERGLDLATKLGEPAFVVYAQTMLAYCRLEQAGFQIISVLENASRHGDAGGEPIEEALAQLKDALRLYVQARGAMAFTSGSGLEAELDKLSATLRGRVQP